MFLSLGASAQYCHSVVSIETFNNCYQLHQTCERRYLSFIFPEILRVYGIFLFSPPHIGRFVCFQTFIFCTSLHLPGRWSAEVALYPRVAVLCNANPVFETMVNGV
jgi:hypothetical protein